MIMNRRVSFTLMRRTCSWPFGVSSRLKRKPFGAQTGIKTFLLWVSEPPMASNPTSGEFTVLERKFLKFIIRMICKQFHYLSILKQYSGSISSLKCMWEIYWHSKDNLQWTQKVKLNKVFYSTRILETNKNIVKVVDQEETNSIHPSYCLLL